MSIKIKVKNLYGKAVAYPICDDAKLFAAIAGTSTLTTRTLRQIQALGYEILIEQNQYAEELGVI